MRGLPLLIELAQRETDERSAELSRVARAKAELEAALAAHEEQLAKESQFVAADPTIMIGSGAWSRRAVKTRSLLRAQDATLSLTESEARDALRSAYIDQKRLELARDAQEREQIASKARQAETKANELHALTRIREAA